MNLQNEITQSQSQSNAPMYYLGYKYPYDIHIKISGTTLTAITLFRNDVELMHGNLSNYQLPQNLAISNEPAFKEALNQSIQILNTLQ